MKEKLTSRKYSKALTDAANKLYLKLIETDLQTAIRFKEIWDNN